jgi:hypothetical protein
MTFQRVAAVSHVLLDQAKLWSILLAHWVRVSSFGVTSGILEKNVLVLLGETLVVVAITALTDFSEDRTGLFSVAEVCSNVFLDDDHIMTYKVASETGQLAINPKK